MLQAINLSRVGWQDVNEIVKRLMYKLLTNEIGRKYSWDGAKGKLKFKTMRLSAVLIGKKSLVYIKNGISLYLNTFQCCI